MKNTPEKWNMFQMALSIKVHVKIDLNQRSTEYHVGRIGI
jgi:hypothetical protein